MTTFDSLFALASPTLQGYRDDLEKHDREAIEANPGVPFIHWTRRNGTHITFLPEADTYPRDGVTVPYLFGHADRWHILREKDCNARFFLDPCYEDTTAGAMVVYFDGRRLSEVTVTKALEIVKVYQRRIEAEWRGPRAPVGHAGPTMTPAHCYC
jgi:hypothetical protein